MNDVSNLPWKGLYWSDIRSWDSGKDIYPVEIKNKDGEVLQTKFPGGYLEFYNLLSIPDRELSLNENLVQNPGW